jgi:hypothetical protein
MAPMICLRQTLIAIEEWFTRKAFATPIRYSTEASRRLDLGFYGTN